MRLRPVLAAHPSLDAVNARLQREAEGAAYWGYLIRYRAIDDLFYISKDKAHISCAKSMEDARREVDGLL